MKQRKSIITWFHLLVEQRNNTKDIERRRGEVSWGKLEGEMNHERLWTLKNNLRALKGQGVGG